MGQKNDDIWKRKVPPLLPGETLVDGIKRLLDGPAKQGCRSVDELIEGTENIPRPEKTSEEYRKVIRDYRKRVAENLRVMELQQVRIWELEFRLRERGGLSE